MGDDDGAAISNEPAGGCDKEEEGAGQGDRGMEGAVSETAPPIIYIHDNNIPLDKEALEVEVLSCKIIAAREAAEAAREAARAAREAAKAADAQAKEAKAKEDYYIYKLQMLKRKKE